MPPGEPEAGYDAILRPWRRAAAVLSILQMLGLPALFAVLLFASASAKPAGYVLAGGILVLEVGQWTLARAALRRCPGFDPRQRYASLPLEPAHRRLVEFNLTATVLAPVVLAPIIPSSGFEHEKLIVFVLLVAGMAPSALSLWRVRHNRSWLAISRIPANPRRRPTT